VEHIENFVDATVLPGTRFLTKAVCKLCGETVFNAGLDSTGPEIDRETLGMAAHFEFSHGFVVKTFKCEDPGCLEEH